MFLVQEESQFTKNSDETIIGLGTFLRIPICLSNLINIYTKDSDETITLNCVTKIWIKQNCVYCSILYCCMVNIFCLNTYLCS